MTSAAGPPPGRGGAYDRGEGDLSERAGLAWSEARSFADLLALGRRFLTGEIETFPGWRAAELDDESDALLPPLLALNAAGLLSVASQPGAPFAPGHDGRSWGGRAFIGGFAEPAEARAIAADARAGGLLALEAPPGGSDGFEVPAGLRDGMPYLVLGADAREAEIEIFEEEASPAAAEALRAAAFLWLVDPAWGRRERFLRALGGVSFGANE
ncbi:MAG: hypothetical protein AAFP86_00975 [Planctomycetota bacterium]